MSQQERDRLEWLKRARDEKLTQRAAAEKMGVSERWVRKLLWGMEREGDRVVVHGLRGRASNRKIAAPARARVLELLRQPDWHDFGPRFASEQLARRHNIAVSDETLRQWMIEAGLWKSRKRNLDEAHCWRPRRSGFGERGLVRHLVRMIDEPTCWSSGRLVERDATVFNMAVLWEYLDKNGCILRVGHRRFGDLQIPSHTPGGEPRATAPTRRPASFGEAA